MYTIATLKWLVSLYLNCSTVLCMLLTGNEVKSRVQWSLSLTPYDESERGGLNVPENWSWLWRPAIADEEQWEGHQEHVDVAVGRGRKVWKCLFHPLPGQQTEGKYIKLHTSRRMQCIFSERERSNTVVQTYICSWKTYGNDLDIDTLASCTPSVVLEAASMH